jgi:clorobiocin biosynthesis protein CloN6
MAPFLDPGSRFFEDSTQHGYTIYHRTLEQHRQALIAPVWHKRLNYCTDWLSRRELQDVSYDAVAKLVSIKGELRMVPASWCKNVLTVIEETRWLLAEIEGMVKGGGLSSSVRNQILAYNRRTLAYSSDQIIPTPRPFGGRWFDDAAIPARMIAELTPSETAPATSPPSQPG